ncbi:DUF4350 domain-containing protein [Sphaerimonospora thailandensis]|uniref:DUF4350 domain-containing protein n=1 Tax=Sphaerimonospora thailandensis TaxID=795644 RepID=A0A8J3W1M0_9ACTN|nr:DUF4350 domain-containing protein [Sphaerimonospora thailandensis]GIH72917.1 hypothetical protein Mth01_51700 [Sphaerimonospora thailandensis]
MSTRTSEHTAPAGRPAPPEAGDATRTVPPATAGTAVVKTGRWRRLRGVLLVGIIVVAAAVVPVLLTPSGEAGGRYLDPADTSLAGARALADVLADHGVAVERVDSVSAALARAGSDSLLLVTEAGEVTATGARRLAASPADRLIVGRAAHLDILASGVTPKKRDTRTRSRDPECGLHEATRAGSAYLGGMSFTGPAGSVGCYPAGANPTLVRYVLDGRTITVVGDGDFMTNLRLSEDGNAALAINLAGAKRRLVWLVPPDAAAPGTDGSGSGGPGGDDPTEARSLGDLVPDGVNWAIFQLVVAVALVAVWRGRRLGPVVVERLPVIVRASETVEGRGRLYRARRARDRAALALRAAAADRITPRLGLPATAAPDEIAAAVAVRTGEDLQQVRTAMYGPAPTDDAGLVALAEHLDRLERQVRDS